MIVGGLGIATSIIGAISSYGQAIWLQESLAKNEGQLLSANDPDLKAIKERRRSSVTISAMKPRETPSSWMKRGLSFRPTTAVHPSARYAPEADDNDSTKESK